MATELARGGLLGAVEDQTSARALQSRNITSVGVHSFCFQTLPCVVDEIIVMNNTLNDFET